MLLFIFLKKSRDLYCSRWGEVKISTFNIIFLINLYL